ncbi:ComEC/Rec2 family competence protein [Frankia sp. QA3]|uniref:ComEC/Rec2 family competence protein n=1 Tax=Frankia sp. QA3 TaxID=710111 RepID=UPI000269C386|nr:ComEC/Rec2 family competence protein [Frankia sp. QA3]EIV93353.1 ComEC/Rec2-related protein [Frankia sp. QA3]
MVAVGMETGLALPQRSSSAAQPADARLVAPALAAWVGTAVAVRWALPDAALVLAAAAVLTVPAALLARARSVRRRRAGSGHTASPSPFDGDALPPSVAVVLTAVVFLAVGVLAGGLATRPGDTGPLADLVRRGASMTARAVVTDDPRPAATAAPAFGPPTAAATTFVVPVRLERVAAGPVVVRLRATAILLGRGAGWRGLLPSQHLDVVGRFAVPRAGDTVAAVVLATGAPRPQGEPDAVQRFAGRLRAGLRDAAAGLPEPRRGLLPALVVGDVSGLDEGLRADFRRAGMSHLTAVSGGNVVVVTASALVVAAWGRRGLRGRAAAGAAALLGFVVLARPSASVLRAAVMGLIGLAAFAAGRPRAVLPALAASVTALVLAQPALAVSVGFALSVQATAGMIIFAAGWHAVLARRLPDRLAEVLAVAAAAQLACTPVLAWIGGGLSLVAIPANVLAVAAVPAATVLGVLVLIVAPVSPPLARMLAHVADLPCWWLVTVARGCADLPAATVGWPAGVLGAVTAALAVIVAVAALRRRWGRRVAAAAVVGLLLARCAVVERIAPWPPVGWRLVACDVGQGDALVLSAGPGSAVLVDAGPDPDLLARCLDELGVHRLPMIVLSHLHADHVDGLPGVLGRLPVGEVLVGPLREPAGQWRSVRRWVDRARVPLRTIGAGAWGGVGAVCWTVLAPRTVLHGTDSDPNNDSLVLSARVGAATILLTGDVEATAQRLSLGHPQDRAGLRADVLKVPHHGSADQDPGFLAASGARFALISVGTGNDYGHPAASTLRTLQRAGMAVARTDRDGALAVVAPGAGQPGRPGQRCPGPGADPSARLAAPDRAPVSVVRRRSGDGS